MKKEISRSHSRASSLPLSNFLLKRKHKCAGADGTLKCLYESEVPEPVREYLDSRAAPAARPQAVRQAGEAPKPQASGRLPAAVEREGELRWHM